MHYITQLHSCYLFFFDMKTKVEINIRPTTVRDNSLDLDNIDVPLCNVQVVVIPIRGDIMF